jgi:hypothetical protein
MYLSLIQGSNTYKQSYIDNLSVQNQKQINFIQSDGALMNSIDQQYGLQTSQIVVVNDVVEP